MDNLEEMDRFLENFNLPRLNQEEIEITNSPIYNNWNWSCDKKFPKNKSPGPDAFHRRILSNIQRRPNAYPSKTLPENYRGR